MKSLFKNNRGFTLAELMVAGGVAGVVALVAVTSIKTSNQASNIVVVGSEASTLKSIIASTLSNPDGCKLTFPKDANIARTNIEVKTQSGAIIAKRNLVFGPKKEFAITDISSSSVVGSHILKLKVDYSIRAHLDKAGKKAQSFVVDVFVNKNTAEDKIEGCYVDIAGSTRKAIELSCKGNGATYDATSGTYGTCTHTLPEVRNSLGVSVPSGLCPTGEYLQEVKTDSTTTPAKLVLQCKKLSIGPCGKWEYIRAINPSDGGAICVKISDLYAQGKVIATSSAKTPTYNAVNLNCPANYVVRKIDANGVPECVPKQINVKCTGANEYIYKVKMISKDVFEAECRPITKTAVAACPSGQYLQKVNSDGSIPSGGCVNLIIPANCPATQFMTGISSTGAAVCSDIF